MHCSERVRTDLKEFGWAVESLGVNHQKVLDVLIHSSGAVIFHRTQRPADGHMQEPPNQTWLSHTIFAHATPEIQSKETSYNRVVIQIKTKIKLSY